nr:MAG TPA: chemotaxis protein [Caudoviricetes sp.]
MPEMNFLRATEIIRNNSSKGGGDDGRTAA